MPLARVVGDGEVKIDEADEWALEPAADWTLVGEGVGIVVDETK